MTIDYENIHQAIAALNQCVKENENKQTDTGAIRVSDLCADVSYFLCKVRQDYKQWQETKDGKMHVYVFSNSDDETLPTFGRAACQMLTSVWLYGKMAHTTTMRWYIASMVPMLKKRSVHGIFMSTH